VGLCGIRIFVENVRTRRGGVKYSALASEVGVQVESSRSLVRTIVTLIMIGVAAPVAAQAPAQAAAPMLGKDEIAALAKVYVAISVAHDSIDAQLAQSRNKTAAAQKGLQEKLHEQVEEILHHGGMTDSGYSRKTFLISTDSGARHAFDDAVAQLTGVPTPGQLPSGANKKVAVPAGPAGVHIGHVVNGFSDTPGGQALLAVAMTEARTAAQHATLAGRNPSDLNYMKTHAGHVLNALDPTIEPKGPGLGYGLKKAAIGVETHIELAAKAEGASPNVVMHANHISTAAKNVVQRADQLIAIAKQIQAATDAAAAATLVNQMISLSQQLIAGVDSNGDGQITWQEGGLQQAEEHVNMMLGAGR
jgi:hypothetical protein